MSKRYAQYCPVAHALELVGERWALLVVRELLNGPKRYTDLAAALPGIGTNILAGRLRDLEEAGVVRKRKLPPPAASWPAARLPPALRREWPRLPAAPRV
jgi:DNA-binding HxlR family transcriptional regulator